MSYIWVFIIEIFFEDITNDERIIIESDAEADKKQWGTLYNISDVSNIRMLVMKISCPLSFLVQYQNKILVYI